MAADRACALERLTEHPSPGLRALPQSQVLKTDRSNVALEMVIAGMGSAMTCTPERQDRHVRASG